MRIGIIGSSGKVTDRHLLSKQRWLAMKERLSEKLLEMGLANGSEGESEKITLVSGGSSWADHMAVEIYLENPKNWSGLELFLPAPLAETGYVAHPPYFRVGRTLNSRHAYFSTICYDGDPGRSLRELCDLAKEDLTNAPESSCRIIVEPRGFKARNSLIADRCDSLMALTVRDKIEGGTRDTWQKFPGDSSQRHQLIFSD